MKKRLGAIAVVVTAGVAAAGLLAGPSNSARIPPSAIASSGVCFKGPPCFLTVGATGPSPSTVRMIAGDALSFENTDSVAHTVVFSNGRCTLNLPPYDPSNYQGRSCRPNFPTYVGRYDYSVDGKFPGTVVTVPWRRSVSLTAHGHGIRRGTRLTLRGRVAWQDQNPVIAWKGQLFVTVLARHDSRHRFEPVARVRVPASFPQGHDEDPFYRVSYGWKRDVRPGTTTTYIAKVTGGAPPNWHGQFWINAKSRPFTVRVGTPAKAGLRRALAHVTHKAARATTIRVSTHNSRYVLSSKSAPRGVVIFKIHNPASQPHDFSINGHTSKLLTTGQSTTLRVTFRRRGRYSYKDTFDHHAQFGCRGGFRIK